MVGVRTGLGVVSASTQGGGPLDLLHHYHAITYLLLNVNPMCLCPPALFLSYHNMIQNQLRPGQQTLWHTLVPPTHSQLLPARVHELLPPPCATTTCSSCARSHRAASALRNWRMRLRCAHLPAVICLPAAVTCHCVKKWPIWMYPSGQVLAPWNLLLYLV
jgi:hypothetical protein